jgi:hypothetical protein
MAQGTGKIAGSVDDENGALAGVNVILEGTFLGSSTDSDGMYLINHVPAGTYIVIANYIGYKTQKKEVTVNAEESVKVNFTLEIDLLQMDAVIITGTPGGLGIRKRDASFAINTIDATEIERLSPSSTASVLDVIPGVWSESTGGVAGANIMVRGLPSGGDAPFVTMSINGGPVYGVETLSFLEQSTMFRVDETIELTEASRGGPSAVFSNAEPGMTVNFNLKKGGEKTKGRMKYQTSDYNLQRIDAVMSGKVAEGLYYMAGGYARTSPGVRSTEFNAENGKQFTMQLTKAFDRGALNFFTRITDDYGQWVLPMALETGNDLGTFSPLGNANRFRTLQINTQGDSARFDFAKGRGWKGSVSGLSFNFDLGEGWMVSDVLTYTSGDANTFGFVPNGNPIKVSALGLDTVRTRGGEILSGSEYIQNYGYWVVMKNLESINNDISLNKIWDDHNITLGLYQARWTSNDFWTLGNHVPVHNVANGDLLEEGITADSLANHDGGGSWNYGLQSAGDARVFAVYGADSWQMMPALRFDIGLRYQFIDLKYTLDHGDLPDGQTDVAESLSGKDFAVTAAINYDFTKELGVFTRGSRSYLFPNFDLIRDGKYSLDKDGNIEANAFMQYELGLKYTSTLFSLFTTGFYNTVGGVGSTREAELLSTKTFGVELDGALSLGNFMLRAVGTFQKGEITDSDLLYNNNDVVGNSIWRQPDLQLRVAPSYNLAIGNYNATIYGALRHAGKRWDSVENVYQLDPYTKIDLGAVVSTPGGMSFGIHADNLTDCEGLTEGDPRDPASANGRPLFGRSIKFSVTHDF